MRELVAFDEPETIDDGAGGSEEGWNERFSSRAEFSYQRGAESELAGRVSGTAVFRVKLRTSSASRGIQTHWRMRDVRRGVAYNIREVDAITDRYYVWLRVQSGVAI